MWTDFDGKPYTRAAFLAHLDNIPTANLRWCKFLCVHNTAAPSIAQWSSKAASPAQRIVNLQHFYENERGWHAGPHGFVPPDPSICLYGFSSFTAPGVHASCFNKIAVGLELVGDFDSEDFNSGPGAIVRANAIFVLAALHNRLGLQPDGFELGKSGLHFHVDCKRDNHACPGRKVQREPLVQAVLVEMERLKADGQRSAPVIAAPHDPSAPIAGAIAGGASAVASVPVLSLETEAPAPSLWVRLGAWFDSLDFRRLDKLQDMGSRSAGAANLGKKLLVRGGTTAVTVAGGAATLIDPTKGNAAMTGSWASEHPVLLLLIGIAVTALIVGGIGYYFLRKAAKGVLAAHDEGRYLPRGAV